MRQVTLFYVLCCFGNLIYHFGTSYYSSDFQDMEFGLPIGMLFVLLLYSPLCTLLAYIYKISRINMQIIKHPILYSLSPFIITSIITSIFNINIVFRDYMLIVFILTENLLIIIVYCFQKYKKGGHDSNDVKHGPRRFGAGSRQDSCPMTH